MTLRCGDGIPLLQMKKTRGRCEVAREDRDSFSNEKRSFKPASLQVTNRIRVLPEKARPQPSELSWGLADREGFEPSIPF